MGDSFHWHFAVLFLIYFAALWCLASFVTSCLSGWFELSRRFHTRADFAGPQWRLRTGRGRFLTRYRHVLTIGCNSEGLYLAILFLFRPGHPPLFIPWNEISVHRVDGFLFGDSYRFTLGTSEQIPLFISGRLGREMREAVREFWPEEQLI